MRDTLKSKEYFKKYIDIQNESISDFLEMLSSTNKNDTIKIERCNAFLSRYYWEKCNAQYSIGDDIQEVLYSFKNSVYFLYKTNYKKVTLAYIHRLLSFAIVINDKKSIKLIKDFCEREKINDEYLRILLDGNISKISPILSEFGYLKESDLSNEEELIKYLDKRWYRGNKKAGWYDTHKIDDFIYYGYWAYDVAALVVIMNYDNSKFKSIKYYPYDLVEYGKNGN